MANKNIVVIARIKAKDGHEDRVKFALQHLIGPTRIEEGCQSYNWHQVANDKTLFMSYEIWESMSLFQKHLETPYIKAMQESGGDILEGSLDVTILEAIG